MLSKVKWFCDIKSGRTLSPPREVYAMQSADKNCMAGRGVQYASMVETSAMTELSLLFDSDQPIIESTQRDRVENKERASATVAYSRYHCKRPYHTQHEATPRIATGT